MFNDQNKLRLICNQFQDVDVFLKNPREFLSSKAAETFEQYSSMSNKRQCGSDNRYTVQHELCNYLIKAAPEYDFLNLLEKGICSRNNILPAEYIVLKNEIIK